MSPVHMIYVSHKDTPHTPMTCKNVSFVDLEYLEGLFTIHAVNTGKTSGMNKTGKELGSVIHQNKK